MKTLRLIGMALIAIVMSVNFVACSDDDDENPLFGTWVSVYTENSVEYKEVETFNSDGTGSSAYYENGKIDKEGVRNFKYAFDESTKILTYIWADGDTYAMRVKELTSSKLVLVDDVDDEGNGEVTTYTKQ